MNKSKKGQKPAGGGGAAALVAIITILIVLYIVFLPAEERNKILDDKGGSGEGSSSGGGSSSDREYVMELLEVHPGYMDYLSRDQIEHLLPSVNLVTNTEGKVLEEETAIYVKKGVFSEKEGSLSFTIEDLENTDNVLLSFTVKEYKGRLIISLNDNDVFDAEISETNVEPIVFKKKDLRNINKITFKASSPGVAFWKTNEYLLENIKVIADVTSVEGRKSSSVFVVDNEEISNLDKIKVKFVPDCDPGKVGKLSVVLNGNSVFSGIPDCGAPFIQEFAAFYLSPGENKLQFSTEKGVYLIDRIELDSLLKEPKDFVYDFDLNETLYKDVQGASGKVNVSFDFIDSEEYKEAELIINGHKTQLSTSDKAYSRIIDPYVQKDYNYIKIVPKKKMYVATVTVTAIKEKD